MAIATTTQRENLAIAAGNGATHVSVHTADPGSTGANEVGTRAPITWVPGPADGQITGTATVTVTAGTAITHVGLWTAVSGGTFLDKATGAATSTGSVAVTLTYSVA